VVFDEEREEHSEAENKVGVDADESGVVLLLKRLSGMNELIFQTLKGLQIMVN
jgi:hypothetical protein